MGQTKFVTVHLAPSYLAAQLLCGLLKSEGLHPRVAGDQLSDEFGMSQKLGVNEVGVPMAEYERASDIVAAWVASKDTGS